MNIIQTIFAFLYVGFLIFNTIYAKQCNVLVLSGGGSHGAYEASVLSTILEENDYDWDILTGVSAGSLNALYISTIPKGQTKDHIIEFKTLWSNIRSKDIYSWSIFSNKLSLFSTKQLRPTLESIFNNRKIKRKIVVSSTSLTNMEADTFDENLIMLNNEIDLNYIIASTAIPFAFPPHYFNDQWYIDGGATGNILLYDGINRCDSDDDITVDIVLCTPFYKTTELPKPDKISILNLFEPLYDLFMDQIEYTDLIHHHLCTEKISKIKINLYRPKDDFKVNYVDFNQGERLWNEGKENLLIEHYYLC